MVGSVIIPVVIVLGLAVVAAVIVFFGVKLRSGEHLSIPIRSLLTAYFYLLSIAGLITLLIGLSGLLSAGLAVPLGRDFSYTRPPVQRPIPAVPEGVPQPKVPSVEEQQQDALRQQDRQFREGLLQGISLIVVGGLVWALHTLGRRRSESAEERDSGFLHIGYLVIMLVICSLVGMISLASGIFDTLRFYLIGPASEFEFRTPPGQNMSAALVFTPAWAYYLLALLRSVRRRQRAG